MKFVVPNTSAGMVIGKNGSSIKEIRETTTANIQIYPKAGSDEAKNSVERVITIGHEYPDVLINAVQRVLEKIAQGLKFDISIYINITCNLSDPMHAQSTENLSKTEPVVICYNNCS
jgi:ribosomal protein S3